MINDEELTGIWSEDETIGWVYQYFTPKELRDKARKESQAPRNSYELAFRNQFYTPRYVVQFLVDNTLGRMWYEMRQGNTRLVEQCRYDGLYIFKYSRRPGTPAARLADDVPDEEKKVRFLALEDLQRKIQDEIYAGYLGHKVSVLVEGISARSRADVTGHSSCHKVVNFRGDATLSGRVVDVCVTEAKPNSLFGELVT